jgi:hypothetical protein
MTEVCVPQAACVVCVVWVWVWCRSGVVHVAGVWFFTWHAAVVVLSSHSKHGMFVQQADAQLISGSSSGPWP